MALQQHEGETPEFTAFLEASMEGLRLQTEAHQGAWRLGESDRWDFSQDTGELIFTFPDMEVRTAAQIVGTFDSAQGTWMWGWANPSIDPRLVRDSTRAREHGAQHRIRRLTERKWPGEEIDAWRMTALTNRLCSSNGAYLGPAGSTYVFFTFGEVRLMRTV